MNLRTAVVAASAALPALLERGGGRIINIGAGAAAKAGAGMGAYAASKAGVQQLTEALSEEMKDRGITVNADPARHHRHTAQPRSTCRDADFSKWVAPAAIAEIIVFLASDAAARRSPERPFPSSAAGSPSAVGRCADNRTRRPGLSPTRAAASRRFRMCAVKMAHVGMLSIVFAGRQAIGTLGNTRVVTEHHHVARVIAEFLEHGDDLLRDPRDTGARPGAPA